MRQHAEFHRALGDRQAWTLQGEPRAATLPLKIAGNDRGYLVSATNNMLAMSFRGRTSGIQVSGLLGHNLLSQLVTTIDYRDGLLRLSVPGAEE